MLAAARLTWDVLLVRALHVPDAEAAAERGDDGALISVLLARPDLSTEARESLEEIARDLAGGTMRDEDRTYLHALHTRLTAA